MGTSLATNVSPATTKPPTFTATPTTVTPPAGYYDPALDAQGRASGRGLDQLLQDLGKAGTRADDQLRIDKGQITQGRDWSLADLLTGKNREGEDYSTATNDLSTSFKRLASSQAGNALQAGVGEGGTFAAAKAARDTNQAHDQSGLDTQHTRFGEDYSTQTGRVKTSSQQQLDDADRLYGYGVVDRADTGQRATNENTFFGQDLGAQKQYQAGQQGWVAPGTKLPTLEDYLSTTKRKPGTSITGATSYVPAQYY
ncbi:hypothetical protein DSM104299_03227 [Baekduia alba]|nr:hypothetical protein DSM104299_03227 [Baekduia alba]